MNNFKVLVFVGIFFWVFMCFNHATADQKCVDPKVILSIFEQMKLTEIYPEQLAGIDSEPSFYISVKKISLARDRETYLVESKRAPFYGTNSPIFWIYEKIGNTMKQIADIECNKLKVLKTSHNDYRDLQASYGNGKVSTYIYSGERYMDR